jgi:hypothetical protein
MTWAQRLKRVFKIDIETCEACGGKVAIIASIEDPVVIEKILTHLAGTTAERFATQQRQARAPPLSVGMFEPFKAEIQTRALT